MTRFCLAILLIVAILLSACAGAQRQSEQEKLRRELAKWESFDGQGIVEVSYLGFAMRKMFSAQKSGQQLRFDIFDGGILGSGAQPMFSLYLADYVAFKSPYLPMLELLSIEQYLPRDSFDLFVSADSLVSKYGSEIIRTKKLERDATTITFTNAYRLDKVSVPKTGIQLSTAYSNSGKLQEIAVKGMDNLSIKLVFDKLEFKQPQITPLPKPAPSFINNAIQGFEGLDLKALLKEFLKKQ